MWTIKRKSGAQLTVAARGGELKSWIAEDGIERLWQGDADSWEETAPWLFPFVGRLHERCYTYEEKTYPMGLHGMIRGAEFELLEQQDESVLLGLKSTAEMNAVYPFDFALRLRYTLSNHGYSCEFFVYHLSSSAQNEMPFGLGAHPGFNLRHPLERYRLELPQADPEQVRHVVYSENGLLKGFAPVPEDVWLRSEVPTLDLGRWDFKAMDLFLEHPGERIVLSCEECRSELSMELDGYPILGLWRATDAPFLCLEPWAALPGREGVLEDLAAKPYMQKLGRGEKAVFSYRVHVS